ncbi:hypothetical protein ACPUER_09995 [Burkholderia sp. DN3021]|uniref:hypothetical protein n=1 Tax=Burkholderia sp. DN3021 TaxID=3410137 RepID=UPI003C7E2C08
MDCGSPRNGSPKCRGSKPRLGPARSAGVRRIGIRLFPFFTISYPNRLQRIVIARRVSRSSRVAMHGITTARGRISAFTGPDRFADIGDIPASRCTAIITKIKVDQFKSLIQVNNSFKFCCDLYLTCVTGCLIFDNPKNGRYSVAEILLITRMKRKS